MFAFLLIVLYLLPWSERGGAGQRERESRADEERARNYCPERGGRTPRKEKGEEFNNGVVSPLYTTVQNTKYCIFINIDNKNYSSWKDYACFFPEAWGDHAANQEVRFSRYGETPCSVFTKYITPESCDAQQVWTNKLHMWKSQHFREYLVCFLKAEVCLSEDFAKWSQTKGKRRACAEWHHATGCPAVGGDQAFTVGTDWCGGHGTCCGLQRAPVSQNSHRSGGNPDSPTSRWVVTGRTWVLRAGN